MKKHTATTAKKTDPRLTALQSCDGKTKSAEAALTPRT
jgi:hypothetical protein